MIGEEPSDEELRAFVDSMLSNLDRQLREPDVIDEAIREHREIGRASCRERVFGYV